MCEVEQKSQKLLRKIGLGIDDVFAVGNCHQSEIEETSVFLRLMQILGATECNTELTAYLGPYWGTRLG